MAKEVWFTCKKWTLFTFCLIGIAFTVVNVSATFTIIDQMKVETDPEDLKVAMIALNASQKIAKAVVFGVCLIAILFELLGLLGACYEHFCMTITYAMFMTLATYTAFIAAYKIGEIIIWVSFVVGALITSMAYLFAGDLRCRDGQSGKGCCA